VGAISPEDQAAIEAISGLAFAERWARPGTSADEAALAEIAEAGIEIMMRPAALLEEIKAESGDLRDSLRPIAIAGDGFMTATAALADDAAAPASPSDAWRT
jgi:hypothetical protein